MKDDGGFGRIRRAAGREVWKTLIIANVAVFLFQLFTIDRGTGISIAESWFALSTAQVMDGQIWRLFTMAFCHDTSGLMHILFNMLFLFWFGRTLEQQMGGREFLLFYVAGALLASAAFVLLDLVVGRSIPAIGASGAIMAVVMRFAMQYPRQKLLLFLVFPVELRWVVLMYVVFDLTPVLSQLMGKPVSTGTAHAAHLGGLAFGFFYWKQNLRLEPYWEKFTGLFTKKKTPNVGKSAEGSDYQTKIDAILDKVSKEGINSLTPAEKRLLKDSSNRYKNR